MGSVDGTWRSRLLVITIVSDEIFGSLSSSGFTKVSSIFERFGRMVRQGFSAHLY